MLDFDLPPEPPAIAEPGSGRWLAVCCLLADPDRAGRALIAALDRWPCERQAHRCRDDGEDVSRSPKKGAWLRTPLPKTEAQQAIAAGQDRNPTNRPTKEPPAERQRHARPATEPSLTTE